MRTADFQADMGRLEELERTALEHPEKEVRLEAGVEADAIRSQYELEPLLMQSYYAEKQKSRSAGPAFARSTQVRR